jgi:hypothetical protein
MARIKDYDKSHVVAYFASNRTHDGRLLPTWHLSALSARSTFHEVCLRHAFAYVTHFDQSDSFLKQHYLTNPPFLHFSVPLDSTTFATALILHNNFFIVTAWSYENNSCCKLTICVTSRFSGKLLVVPPGIYYSLL